MDHFAAAIASLLVSACGVGSDPSLGVDGGTRDGADADASHDTQNGCSASGSLDPTFGSGGLVPPLFSIAGRSVATSVAIDPMNSKILVGGSTPSREGPDAFALIRLSRSGELDTSFAFGGVSTTCLEGHACWLERIAIQPDGKIVGVGGISGATGARLGVVRYLPDGSLDPTFGNGGIVAETVAPLAYGVGLALDNERIVVTAEAWSGTAPNDAAYFVTARFQSDGQRDTSFGIDGIAEAAFQNGQHVPRDMTRQADGKIVVVGQARYFAGAGSLGLVRYTSNGQRDPSFGDGGLLTVAFDGGTFATGVAIDNQGRIVVTGDATTSAVITRRLSNGDEDLAYGTAGLVSDDRTRWRPALAPDGKLLVVGSRRSNQTESVALARYQPAGDRDSTFGSNGLVLTTSANPCNRGNHLAIQDDGNVIVVGSRGDCVSLESLDFFVARYCQ